MCYRRSYKYDITSEEKENFINEVKETLSEHGCPVVMLNGYPYDMFRDKKIKTDHKVLFYHSHHDPGIIMSLIKMYVSIGYSVQINSSDNQSIKEIKHLHFIKIIDE